MLSLGQIISLIFEGSRLKIPVRKKCLFAFIFFSLFLFCKFESNTADRCAQMCCPLCIKVQLAYNVLPIYIDEALLYIILIHIYLTQQINYTKSHTTEFTYKIEEDNSLVFLDIKLHHISNSLKLAVHQKTTNKNNLINFYSHHYNI